MYKTCLFFQSSPQDMPGVLGFSGDPSSTWRLACVISHSVFYILSQYGNTFLFLIRWGICVDFWETSCWVQFRFVDLIFFSHGVGIIRIFGHHSFCSGLNRWHRVGCVNLSVMIFDLGSKLGTTIRLSHLIAEFFSRPTVVEFQFLYLVWTIGF